jgi:HD-GYP domain-containing protein (c-di-GMP phosphodiesterase class II)
MFAVIDVYDALTTSRSYHTARSHAEALRALREGAGSHFDPAIVSAFERIPFEQLREIARNNQTSLVLSADTVSPSRDASAALAPAP